MATIKSTITLEDKMSRTLSNIDKQANNNIKTYRTVTETIYKWTDAVGNYNKEALESTYTNEELVQAGFKTSETMQRVEEVTEDASQAMGDMSDEGDGLDNTLIGVNQTLELSQKAWNALTKAIKEAYEWTEQYNNQFNAEFTAGTSMSAMLGMSSSDINEIYSYASEMQSKGVLGDEALVSGAGIMSSAASSKDALKGLMEAAANATVANEGLNASQSSYESTANKLRMALEGQSTMLVRNNILTKEQADYIDSINDKEKKESELIKLVNQNTQNANETLALTASGGMMQANNALGDMQEQLGEGVLPYFVTFKQMLVGVLQPITDFASANMDVLAPTFLAVAGGLGVLIAGLTIYKVVSMLAAAGTLAMAAPFLILIALIGAFVFAINLAAQKMSEWSGTSVSAIGMVFGALNVVLTALENIFIDLYNVCEAIVDGISLLFIGLAEIVIGVVNGIAKAIDAVFGSNLSSATQTLMDNLDATGQAILNDGNMERKSYSDAYQNGYDFGAEISDNVFGGKENPDNTADIFNKFSNNFDKIVTPASGGGKAIKTTTDDDLLSDDDIQMLLDIATRDYQLNYQQMTPNISVSFGDVRETADVDSVLEAVGTRVEELINGDAEVKY